LDIILFTQFHVSSILPPSRALESVLMSSDAD
jgi:hypothetical protein